MVEYRTTIEGLDVSAFHGFGVGWRVPLAPNTLKRVLEGSSHVVVAIDATTGNVVGFINAISDGVLCAFIPLLEVHPSFQHEGIGSELVRRMLEELNELYAVDLVCDAAMEGFYSRFGLQSVSAMVLRRFDRLESINLREAH
ncbi:MAG TPA: GNAT family N-acetyltransferase [Fimbriimonadaceae bacterium]|nr:GNAT family N-acetyltransferase [Fimbriimonadaceae bacterium]